MPYRTHTCNELRLSHLGKDITLSGWVKNARNFGSILFIDLRDRYGITQLFVDETDNPKIFAQAKSISKESVIQVSGEVLERSNKNPKIETGEIEIKITEIEVLSAAKNLPFTIVDDTDGGEEQLLKYRYLDLRREVLKNNLILRHKVYQTVRKFLADKGFLEIETPFLINSTPEGARDFLVPSRNNHGSFYSLPQSPQIYKQLLMVSGFDKYFQIVKCFRDEDFRADRQPEFTQIDCEMSFVNQEQVMEIFEALVKTVFQEIKGIHLQDFPVLKYDYCLKTYGSDRPDLRYDLKIHDISEKVKNSTFKIFATAEFVGGIIVKKSEANTDIFSRKTRDKLTEYVKSAHVGASGMVYARVGEKRAVKSSVDKFFEAEEIQQWFPVTPENGDIIFVLSGNTKATLIALGRLREHLAKMLNIIPKNIYKTLWVIDFPLMEKDEKTGDLHAMHHPFTAPKETELNTENILETQAKAYDMVVNGAEIGGGSIRIHNKALQQKIFSLLPLSESQIQEQFGFLLEAFEYGVPPHGGIAFGLDRICTILSGATSIRDCIAFPKKNNGQDAMTNSPTKVSQNQLEELGLSLRHDTREV